MTLKLKFRPRKDKLDNWITLVVDDNMMMAFQKILEHPKNNYRNKSELIRDCLKRSIPTICSEMGINL